MNKIILAAVIVAVVIGAYHAGLNQGKKETLLLLAEQYVRNQINEASFDQIGIREINKGKEDGIRYMQNRIQFRFRDLNAKLDDEVFWNAFLPSFKYLFGFGMSPEETFQELKARNESYQQDYSENDL